MLLTKAFVNIIQNQQKRAKQFGFANILEKTVLPKDFDSREIFVIKKSNRNINYIDAIDNLQYPLFKGDKNENNEKVNLFDLNAFINEKDSDEYIDNEMDYFTEATLTKFNNDHDSVAFDKTKRSCQDR